MAGRHLAACAFSAAFLLLSAAVAGAAVQDVTVDGGAAPLAGTLLTPEGSPRTAPAVLLIAGSGPTDRDGNQMAAGLQPNTLKLIAEDLAAHGYASLRTDKRAVAKSAAAGLSEHDLKLDVYVDDTVRWAEKLAQTPNVTCVVLLGHSEGALIAALAATKTPVCGVISISGIGRPIDVVIDSQLRSRGLPEETMAKVDAVWNLLKKGQELPGIVATDALFRPSVQPYLISLLQHPPTDAIAAVTAPVLILQGTTDLQTSLEDADNLAKAQPRARLVKLTGVNHVLKTAPADSTPNFATYMKPDLPLDPQVMPAILGFMSGLKPAKSTR